MATALSHLSSDADLPRFLKLCLPSSSSHHANLDHPIDHAAAVGTSQLDQTVNKDKNPTPASTSLDISPPPSHPLLVPPLNFQNVTFGISRSGHPNERNYEFLRRLRLKTIMYVATDEYRPRISKFAEEEGIKVLHFRISVNKEPFAEMEEDIVAEAISQALDRRNYPLLIHCNKGKARVGVITGIIRRLQGWSHTSIFEEYARFAGTKALDEEFIEVFDLSRLRIDPLHQPDWL